ncbi:hypothetical protein D3I60_16900 [Brevibacterium permense]|uniref:hypothetical protein n=1 Tax=Brevibacterium permense TaxID=234834 RepID=UPI0021D0C065|nr:hypothetical protein [Brevibacterium permense]MCU4298732.1 hypothetical protein [Brevibacterium permense]
MPAFISTHAAKWGVAAFAGLASLGLAVGPASADSAPASSAAQAPQSSGHPKGAVKYVDRLITAYGIGDAVVVDQLAAKNVVAALADHDDGHAKRWHRTSADSGKGYTWVSYTNLDTQEVMNLTVRNAIAANKGGDAVREIEFVG